MTRDVPEEGEAQALRLIAVSFFALAGYVAVQAVFDLVSRSEPESSTVGIALSAVSLVVMPTFAGLKRRNGIGRFVENGYVDAPRALDGRASSSSATLAASTDSTSRRGRRRVRGGAAIPLATLIQ